MKPGLTRVKICCISTVEEARLALSYGASALGLVGRMPSGPGVIEDEAIQEIAKSIPPVCGTFLLSSETTVEELISHHRKTLTNTLQIVDYVARTAYGELRQQLPHLKLVQVIHIEDESAIDFAREVAPLVDALLLDSGNTKSIIKELGGTGRVHNWEISRKIVEAVQKPIFLAGGLTEHNVQEAIRTVRPFGLDLCSSVRTDGKLDEEKLARFMCVVRDFGRV